MRSLLDLPDEKELRRLIGTKPYWDQTHPDHASTNQRVQDGFKRLYPSRNEGKLAWPPVVMPTDAAFQANMDRGRQWLRDGGYRLMAQAEGGNQDEAKPPASPPPRPEFKWPENSPEWKGSPDPFGGASVWVMKQGKVLLDWLGLPDYEAERLRARGGGGPRD